MITKLFFGFIACMLLLAVILSILERCGIDTNTQPKYNEVSQCSNYQNK